MNAVEAVRWSSDGDAVDIIDQRLLPGTLTRRELRTVDDVCDAIATLAVRGAPAIGVAGAMGLAAALRAHAAATRDELLLALDTLSARIGSVRPTAVNLPWAMARMRRAGHAAEGDARAVYDALRHAANEILEDDRRMCRCIAAHGLDLIPPNARVLTHCNAGALATSGMGTALAPLYLAAEQGHALHVYANETRPLLQGSRLTAWELAQAGVRVTVLTDGMAASLMRDRAIDLVIVGADRIATNGDVPNKIGTYSLAVAAHYHGIPFYVAAPWSTVDPGTPTGSEIAIEHRDGAEVRGRGDIATMPEGAGVHNPAFDITPAELVSAIITDRGVMRPPFAFDSDGHSANGRG